MKTNVFLGIAIRIIVLCLIGMSITFITPELRIFFGDVYIPKSVSASVFESGDYWSWGIRHYWYCGAMVLLFILSLINVIMQIIKIIEKNYGKINL